jgi:hypothetical protein
MTSELEFPFWEHVTDNLVSAYIMRLSAGHFLSSPAVHFLEEISNVTAVHRCLMTTQQIALCERLKRLGYEKDKKLRMYGEDFDLISDPITISEHLYVVYAIERKSKSFRRVRIPLPIINMVRHDLRAA